MGEFVGVRIGGSSGVTACRLFDVKVEDGSGAAVSPFETPSVAFIVAVSYCADPAVNRHGLIVVV